MDSKLIEQTVFVARTAVNGPIRRVVIHFSNDFDTTLKTELTAREAAWAAAGALVLVPYLGPWAWMNVSAREVVHRLLDHVYDEFGLEPGVPIVTAGTGIAGHAALEYAMRSRRVSGVLAIDPVTDLAAYHDEHAEVPRTLQWAFSINGQYSFITGALHDHSPLLMAASLAVVPNLIVTGTLGLHPDGTPLVNPATHGLPLIDSMREKGFDVTHLDATGEPDVDGAINAFVNGITEPIHVAR